MTSFRKSAAATLAALTIATTVLASAGAEARPRFHRGHGWGVGAGIAALAVGGLLASRAYGEPAYVEEDAPVRRCELVERINRFGEVIGHRRVCSVY